MFCPRSKFYSSHNDFCVCLQLDYVTSQDSRQNLCQFLNMFFFSRYDRTNVKIDRTEGDEKNKNNNNKNNKMKHNTTYT